MHNKLKKAVLLLGDILVLYFSLYLALLLRYWSDFSLSTWLAHLMPFTLAFFVWIIIFYIADLYNLHLAVNNARFFTLTMNSILIAALLTVTFFYVNPDIDIAPKTNLLIYIVVFFVLFTFWRRLFNWSLNTYLPKDSVAFIGYNEKVEELTRALDEKPHLGFRVKLLATNQMRLIENNRILTFNDINALPETIKKEGISTLVLADDIYESEHLRQALFKCLPLGLNFIKLPDFYEQVTGKIPIDAINQLWFIENLSEGDKKWFDSIKRAYDLIFSTAIFLVTALFWPFIGIIIKLESRGPVFFKQTRTGKNNIPFTMIKFRTMTEDGNNRRPTSAQDPRITGFGQILRKTRIDEIPQVLNIMLGSMSFVGPRPERPELITDLEKNIPFYKERMLAKPGLTGWDQVSGEYHSPSKADTIKKLQYDLFYIKNRSLYLDISIILKTIATVLKRYGV